MGELQQEVRIFTRMWWRDIKMLHYIYTHGLARSTKPHSSSVAHTSGSCDFLITASYTASAFEHCSLFFSKEFHIWCECPKRWEHCHDPTQQPKACHALMALHQRGSASNTLPGYNLVLPALRIKWLQVPGTNIHCYMLLHLHPAAYPSFHSWDKSSFQSFQRPIYTAYWSLSQWIHPSQQLPWYHQKT